MALVDYSSSSQGDEEEDTALTTHSTPTSASLKRKRVGESPSGLPPLPSKFHDLYASTTRVSTIDDPGLHGGRKRVTPHIEGNWPTHLYIEWYPSTTEHGSLTALVSALKNEVSSDLATFTIHSFLTSDLGAPLPLHVSLSRPISFVIEQKDEFVTSLAQKVNSSGIRPFGVSFTALDWVPNFEKTRWFLVLRLAKPDTNGLNRLLHVSNIAVQEYGQPPLYVSGAPVDESVAKKMTQPRRSNGKAARPISASKMEWSSIQDVSDAFHVSIAWTLESPSDQLLKVTESINTEDLAKMKQIQLKIGEIKAKVGNVVTNIPLPMSVVEGRGLFGF